MLKRLALLALALNVLVLASPASATTASAAQCAIAWSSLSASDDIVALRRFAVTCKGTPSGEKAQARIASKVRKQVIATRPPPPPPAAPRLTAPEFVDRGTREEAAGRRIPARRAYAAACKLDDKQGCYQLGVLIDDGLKDGLITDPNVYRADHAEAIAALKKACLSNLKTACETLTQSAEFRTKPKPDWGSARIGAKNACRLGNVTSCNWYATSLLNSTHGETSVDDAVITWEAGCKFRSATACDALRFVTSQPSYNRVSLTDAQQWFDKVIAIDPTYVPNCGKGYAEACAILASHYGALPISATDRRELKAYLLARGACDAGVNSSCFVAAWYYSANASPLANERRKLFEKACATTELSFTCEFYGDSLLNAADGIVSASLAQKQYVKACDSGKGAATACKKMNPPGTIQSPPPK